MSAWRYSTVCGCWLASFRGVITFAVDFSTGAIYLPAKSTRGLDYDHIRTVRFDPQNATHKEIEQIIRQETGRDFSFGDEHLRLSRLDNTDEIPAFFEQVQ